MRKPKFVRRILDRFINFEFDLPKTEPPVLVAPSANSHPHAVTTTMREPKIIRRILDWCNKLKSDLPKILVALPAKSTPPKKKFPIFRLPFLARRNVLLRLELDDLIPLSLLSQRSKRMIKQAVPFQKAQYDCTIWSKEVPTIKISSSFGSYTGINPDVDNIMDLLGYPSFQLFVYGENGITRAAEWVKTQRSCIKMINIVTSVKHREMTIELFDYFIELTLPIELDRHFCLRIPLSFLSKRSKQMIKQALPSKKAQYDCMVWYRENSLIDIKSRFGGYSGFESNIEHIIEVLSYPPIQVVVYGENPVTRAAEWVESYRNCVKMVSFLPSFMNDGMVTVFVNPSMERNGQIETIPSSTPLKDREMILEFVNPLIKLNVRIDLGGNMLVTCSPEEVLIENLNIFPISFLWSLKCQKLRIVDRSSPVLVVAHRLISIWASSDFRVSSTIRQLIFELKETEKIEQWILETGWERSEEEWQHPIIPFSFLSKRCKRMIKQAIPSKIAQYDITVKSKKLTSMDLTPGFRSFWLDSGAKVDDIVTSISIDSQFGHFFMGLEANVHHIMEVLSYPPIRVLLHEENGVTRAAAWLKRYRNCVKSVSFSASPKDIRMHTVFVDRLTESNNQTKYCMKFLPELRYPEVISEFVNLLLELNVRIDFDICASSTIKQLIFELKESERIEEWIVEGRWKKSEEEWQLPKYKEINAWWYKRKDGNDRAEDILEDHHDGKRLENRWEKSEQELQYPIYGKINKYYKMYHGSRKVILFETHYDGKKLLVVDLEQYGIDI